MMTFAEIRRVFEKYRLMKETVVPPVRGTMIGLLNDICNGDRGRKIVLMWLFDDLFDTLDEVTTKKLSDSDWFALFQWMQPERIERGVYRYRDGLDKECAAIWYFQSKKIGELKEVSL